MSKKNKNIYQVLRVLSILNYTNKITLIIAYMRRKIKYLMPVMLACSMMQFSCSDWTDPESINIHTPYMEEQNPELYAQYLESLNNFKATDQFFYNDKLSTVTVEPLKVKDASLEQVLNTLLKNWYFDCD